jgi:TRAP-type C4-dicarboxylate transport system substrate-binding protein
MKLRYFGLIAGLAVSLSLPVKASTLEMTFGHTGEPGSLLALSAEEFANRANERLEGRVEVVVYGMTAAFGLEYLMASWRGLWRTG